MRTILLAGASGLVGRECLRMLLATPEFNTVATLSRQALPPELVPLDQQGRLEQRVVDFDRLRENAASLKADQIICAIGTTLEEAGSRQRFREVDHDYPLAIAQIGLEQGARHFLLVSAMGANPRSMIFYNRVKGEVEEALLALPYESVTIVRPSLLMGNRARPRRGEEMAKRLAFLVPARYKPIPARAVAATLVRMAVERAPGRRIVESMEMRRFV
ncbi:MAG TPA: NAD(P)H-binding protein [Gemmatimonadaceae bacterium]